MLTFSAVLLAGGKSRRMGLDKATLVWGGATLWEHQLQTLRAISPSDIFISARTQPVWCPPEIPFVPDEVAESGPLAGLVATLKRICTTHLLVLAVDLPLVTESCLQDLQARARAGCGVVPVRAVFFEPLCAIYPVAALNLGLEALASEDKSMRTLIEKLRAAKLVACHEISEAESSFFQNVNSPAEFAALERLHVNL